MARTKSDPTVVRPRCPEHPDDRVWLDGFEHCRWSPAHRRPRYRCVRTDGTKGHAFSLPVAVRQPTEHHPDAGRACPACEHVYGRHEGIRTGRDFVFGQAEIARLSLRVGEGMSLRAASMELRSAIFRSTEHGVSRQANLAVNYLDAFAPAIIAALHPGVWPRVLRLDARSLFTRGYRRSPGEPGADERWVGELKAGTILVALDGTARRPTPCLLHVAGAKDTESWKDLLTMLEGAPEVVVADLDPAIARAVRETWPGTILLPSRHHLAALMRERALADGIPERTPLETPKLLGRPLPWTGERTKRWAPHPLHAAMLVALRGPTEWVAFGALVERHVPPDRLALRGWLATNEPLIRRAWELAARHPELPRSRGALEGSIGEWLAPLAWRAGRWQNARRLDLVLGLITLRARGEAREARYARIVRDAFAASGDRAHDRAGEGSDWWRRFQDHGEASLPRLVRDAERRWRRRAADDHAERVRERLARRYEAEVDLRARLGLPLPPTGRPRRRAAHAPGPVRGKRLADYPDLLAEWAWDANAELDPVRLAAGSHERVVWRCLLEPAHVWESRVADRTSAARGCPYHMGIRVHPAESLAAYFPWLAHEWHPARDALHPDQRTLSRSGCPECFQIEAPARSQAGRERARLFRDERSPHDLPIAS